MGFIKKADRTIGSLKAAVEYFVMKIPVGYEFTGWDLENEIHRLYPPSRNNLGRTKDRRMREFRHGKDFGLDYEIVCINPAKSLYKKMSGKDAEKFIKPKRVLM